METSNKKLETSRKELEGWITELEIKKKELEQIKEKQESHLEAILDTAMETARSNEVSQKKISEQEMKAKETDKKLKKIITTSTSKEKPNENFE